jgi:hypothetical protein
MLIHQIAQCHIRRLLAHTLSRLLGCRHQIHAPSCRYGREGNGEKNGLFRIAILSDEFVMVMNKEKVGEYLKAPDSVLNAQEGANDVSSFPVGRLGDGDTVWAVA